jgi:hypothetical protein
MPVGLSRQRLGEYKLQNRLQYPSVTQLCQHQAFRQKPTVWRLISLMICGLFRPDYRKKAVGLN